MRHTSACIYVCDGIQACVLVIVFGFLKASLSRTRGKCVQLRLNVFSMVNKAHDNFTKLSHVWHVYNNFENSRA